MTYDEYCEQTDTNIGLWFEAGRMDAIYAYPPEPPNPPHYGPDAIDAYEEGYWKTWHSLAPHERWQQEEATDEDTAVHPD